jgi:hypothetical protein
MAGRWFPPREASDLWQPGVAGTIPVPDHGNKTLAPGTQMSIPPMRPAGLTEADL